MVVGSHCHIAVRLPHHGLIAQGELLNHPCGDVFRRGIEGQQLIEIAMIQESVHHLLDMLKVLHHSLAIQFARCQINGNHPVMAVQPAALAAVGKIQLMASCHFHCL